MTHTQSPHLALAEFFCSRARIPATAVVILKVAQALVMWSERAKSRKKLRYLEDHRLDDIGVTRAQAYGEYSKPFWKP